MQILLLPLGRVSKFSARPPSSVGKETYGKEEEEKKKEKMLLQSLLSILLLLLFIVTCEGDFHEIEESVSLFQPRLQERKSSAKLLDQETPAQFTYIYEEKPPCHNNPHPTCQYVNMPTWEIIVWFVFILLRNFIPFSNWLYYLQRTWGDFFSSECVWRCLFVCACVFSR